MSESIRRPLVPLPPEERERILSRLQLDDDLIPLSATPAEKEAAMSDQSPAPVATGPAHGAVVTQGIARIGPIISVVLGAVLALPAAGVALPPVVVTICSSLVAVMAALGIASPGVRKP